MRVKLVLSIALLFTAGCAGGAIAPPYTDGELQQRCARDGGWWHPNNLRGGFCDFQSGDMI